MKRIILSLLFVLCIVGIGHAQVISGGGSSGSGVQTAADCNTAVYYAIGKLCQDTGNGKLYKGTGAAVVEIASGASGDVVAASTAQTWGNGTDPVVWTFGVTGTDPTITATAGSFAFNTVLALGANNITSTGSLGSTGAGKLTKGWFVDAEFTNYPTVNGNSVFNQDVTSDANPSFSTLNLVGANALNVGTSGTTDGEIRIKSGTGGNNYYFKFLGSNFGANIGWTFPTAAPAGNDYLLKASTTGVLGYTDPATLGGGYTNLTSFINQTAWRVFYSDGSGDVKELALGADGTYLRGNGASSAPSWDTPTGAAHDALTLDTTSHVDDVFTLSTQRLDFDTQTANYVLAGPATGAAAAPTFRALVSADIPANAAATSSSAASLSVSGQTGLMTVTGLGSTNRAKAVRDAADTILELGGSYTPTGTWNVGSMTFTSPPWGDVTDVWGCTTGNCSALTAASGDTLDASLADSTTPNKTGNTASVPGTCTAGNTYFDSQAKVLYLCTAANTWTQVMAVGADGSYRGVLLNNTAISPTASANEWYWEANILKVNQNGTESSVAIGPTGGQVTFSGPTQARTITVPDAAITVARTDAGQTFTGVQAFTAPTVATSIAPASADGATLGTAAAEFSDLYLADGGRIYFQNDQSVYLTPSASTLALTGSMTATGTVSGLMPTAVYSADGSLNVSSAQATANTFFVNTYAGTLVMTLPAAAAGMAVCLRNGQNNSRILQVHSDGTDYLVLPATGVRNTAANHFAATASPMNQICLVAVDSTDWYITSTVGTWAAE